MCMYNIAILAVINQNTPVIKTNPEMFTFLRTLSCLDKVYQKFNLIACTFSK